MSKAGDAAEEFTRLNMLWEKERVRAMVAAERASKYRAQMDVAYEAMEKARGEESRLTSTRAGMDAN